MQNVSLEHEDGQTIPKHDPIWYDTTDYSDDNNEYTKPTYNDSDLDIRVGYASCDNHNETYPIDELIEARSFQEFYEPLEVNPQRTDVRREWRVFGSEYYSIQIIP